MIKKTNDIKKRNEDIVKTVGTIAASLLSGFVGYKIAENVVNRNNNELKMPENVKLKYNEIHRITDIHKKLEVIELYINNDDWINQYGAILVLFSELELFFDILIENHIQKNNKRKSFRKKIGYLKGERIIENMDYYLLEKIVDTRNQLVHGKYEDIKDEDIKGAYIIIKEFINKYNPTV